MPLGLKPSCSLCKANSSAMWRKSSQGEIVCNNCAGKSPGPGPGTGLGLGPGSGSGSGPASGPGAAPAAQQSNGGGKQAKQEIHRRSARLRNTKYSKSPSRIADGNLFCILPIKAPESVSTIITSESIFYGGIYYQVGDIVSVVDEDDEKIYYAQIRGFVQDQYCEKSAVITWLIPTQASSKDQFDAATYILGPEEDLPRKMEHFEFICHAPSEYFKSRSTPFPVIPTRPEKGYIWTRVGPTPAITVKESTANSL
ncbi:GATA zinc finger domain-containing protein 1 isoform X2 [Heptranchias perlo]|uniref:GATA zinc finger domain-containing protein 1 isoform X2 n=1 Tax=Heptranchias perlo TaxID=212740 RepID=UPI00355947A9